VYFTPRDGLVNSRVRGIQQDSKGRMIFMTYGGFSFYDGARFLNYSLQDGLANELVNDIIEISPDSFLIATNAPVLNTLVKGKIGTLQTADQFYPVINKFLRSRDGSLYAIADDGLFVWREDKFFKLALTDAKGNDIGNNLEHITEWNQYFLLIPWNPAQEEKLIIYDKEKNNVASTLDKKTIASVAVAPNGDLWLTSSDGIEILDPAALQKGKIVLHPLPTAAKVTNWKNAYLNFDASGETWMYQNNEVLHLDHSGEVKIFSSSEGLNTSNLSDLFVDREGNTWLASDGNGIVKMQGANVQMVKDLRPGVKNNISALYQQSDTTWMYNRTDNSVYRLHLQQLTVFPLHVTPQSFQNILIQEKSLYFIADQVMYRVENKDLLSSYARPVKVFDDSLPILECGTGIVDRYGNIIQTIRTGDSAFYLAVLDQHTLRMKQRLSFMADQLAFDQDGILWVPTRDNHLVAYSLHPETPDQYLQPAYDFSDQFSGIGLRSITVDTAGQVWVGTRYQGIYHLEMNDHGVQSISHLTTQDGLTDNFHYQLYCDPHSHIWAGAQTGLDKISFKNGNYIVENITKNKNIFQGIYKIINVSDDIIWAMTSNGGILEVSDRLAPPNLPTPTLFITSLIVNDSLFDEKITEFQYDQNNFSISVAAPSFIDEKSIQYSYQLEGSGKNKWSEGSNTAEFNFINLAPGSYLFHARAEFPAALYSMQEMTYAFTITPPYWQTWWFRILILVFLLGFSILVVRSYYVFKLTTQRRMLEKKQAIEKERTRIATDMHDDLGAGLSRIKFLSETIGIKKQQQHPIDEEVISIRRYAHEMIGKMGEIVWALNEKNDSLSDLVSYTRSYAVEYLTENGIQNKIDLVPMNKGIMVNGEFRRNVFLSVKEVLHNVIKHARAER
jgi:ligand-binding sensor domain-containing protein